MFKLDLSGAEPVKWDKMLIARKKLRLCYANEVKGNAAYGTRYRIPPPSNYHGIRPKRHIDRSKLRVARWVAKYLMNIGSDN